MVSRYSLTPIGPSPAGLTLFLLEWADARACHQERTVEAADEREARLVADVLAGGPVDRRVLH